MKQESTEQSYNWRVTHRPPPSHLATSRSRSQAQVQVPDPLKSKAPPGVKLCLGERKWIAESREGFRTFVPRGQPPAGSRLVQWSGNRPQLASLSPVPPFHNGVLPHQIPPGGWTGRMESGGGTPPTSGMSELGLESFPPPRLPHALSAPAAFDPSRNFLPPLQGNVSKAGQGSPQPQQMKDAASFQNSYNQIQDNFHQESIGGTTYFYNGPMDEATAGTSNDHNSGVQKFYAFNAPQSSVGNFQPRGPSLSTFSAPYELRTALMKRQMLSMAQTEGSEYSDLPSEVESYGELAVLEPPSPSPSFFIPHHDTTYKARSSKDGLSYVLRRLPNCRLVNSKCLTLMEVWKKLSHSNIVHLREVFTTKAFRDYSLIFVYDYYPGAETLKYRHFSGMSETHETTKRLYRQSQASNGPGPGGSQIEGGWIQESLVWSYIIQLSSALRTIHAAGLAARTIHPSKIILYGRSRLLINCCGILDVLTFEAPQMQMNLATAIQHYQQEDMVGLGRVVVALACDNLQASSRDHLGHSLQFIAQHYSQDLQNLVAHLLGLRQPGRPRSINDVMPMIGARFYAQLEASQLRSDSLETELSKELENGRLFRLLSMLGTINERPEYMLDSSWAETGDRYLLKLFRDYLFHQVGPDGRPWLDMSHIVITLNKLDAGLPEKLSLMSRDEENVLVVSYKDLKRCLETTFRELFPPQPDQTEDQAPQPHS